MAFKAATRADDEMALALLRRRQVMSAADAGAPYGLDAVAVRVIVGRVVRADLAESGEDPAEVGRHYQFFGARAQ